MKTLVAYYSYNGSTRRMAEALAAQQGADLCEIRNLKRPGMAKAVLVGCPRAMRGKPSPIQPLEVNLDDYDEVVLLAPVWAGGPAPPANAFIALLPGGKKVDVVLCSASGSTGEKTKARLRAAVESRFSTPGTVRDAQSGATA